MPGRFWELELELMEEVLGALVLADSFLRFE